MALLGRRLSLLAPLVSLCVAGTFLPFGAAFPQESIGWIKVASKPSYRREAKLQPTPYYSSAVELYLLRNTVQNPATLLETSRGGMADSDYDRDESLDPDASHIEKADKRRMGKKEGRRFRSGGGRGFAPRGANATTAVMDAPDEAALASTPSARELEMDKRVTQLEHLVAKQIVEIRRLQEECRKLTESCNTFQNVVELLRAAGLQNDDLPFTSSVSDTTISDGQIESSSIRDSSGNEEPVGHAVSSDFVYEYFDDVEIFGEAPSSVTDAADAAGAAILAGILGGKHRMLVDVRDSELSRDPETLVQFIELAILPVAAGLEGLRSNRNRVKIVFPTVSQLLEYRRTMALAAPEVVALSTLGFDPVEERDNIVVIIAPPPSDEEGLRAMNELLNPTECSKQSQISQPVVVLNHHMVPLSADCPAVNFDVMYHLRLLSVQYMSGDQAGDIFQQYEGATTELEDSSLDTENDTSARPHDELLEAAMRHAHEAGVLHGTTRAMVIRAYPKPWHVFVDVSPDTDADFVVADTFTEEPTSKEVNNAIVECLEGSEREDELVAQQMQQALEFKNGKLDMREKNGFKKGGYKDENVEEDNEEFDDWNDLWNEDSV